MQRRQPFNIRATQPNTVFCRSALVVALILGAAIPSEAWALSVTRGPYLQMGNHTEMTVRWRTDSSVDSVVRYGTSQGNLNLTASQSGSRTEHELRLTGLSSATRYYYSVGTSGSTLSGGDATTFFETAPTPGASQATRIWVIGDSGTANSNATAVYNAYLNHTGSVYTNLWLMLGDNAYNDGTDSQYQAAVFNMYPQMLRQTPVWPTLGNHDGHSADSASESGPYYDIFTLPRAAEVGGVASGTEAYYSFDYANIHFVILDSYESSRSTTGPMLTWMTSDLQATAADWLIAYWHHPPYTKGSHNSDTESALRDMRENALPILEDYGVDLVLSGHSHSYERSFLIDSHYGGSSSIQSTNYLDNGDGRPSGDGAYGKDTAGLAAHEGAVYAVAGSSGKISGGSLDHPAMFISLNQLGSIVLDVDGMTLDAKFVNSSGAVADSFTLEKGTGCTVTETPETSCGDGVDNDCDGDIDALDTDCCTDNDGDGHTASSCGGSDCDDADVVVHPGATEVCDDSVDNDCNGDLDCADSACSNEVICGGSGLQVVTITDLEDSFVRENQASSNFGSASAVEVDTNERKHGLIKALNLGGIPSGATIHRAELVMQIWDPGNDFEIREVTSNWSESSVTWNNRPAVASTVETAVSGATGERRADVAALFSEWVDGTSTNYGVELTPTGSNGVDLRSSEYGTSSQRPYFEVEYSTAGSCTPTENPEQSCSNGLDDDCDGAIDGADTDCCADSDGDGYADVNCGGNDCNDSDANIHPGAAELCTDAIDNDCDGDSDCADGNCSNHPSCCPDNDGDGHDDASCGGSDCNDGNASIHPGATELCNDGVDNNCNGDSDCADAACASDPACSTPIEVTLTAIDDAYTRSNQPNNNYGSSSTLDIDTASTFKQSFIKLTSFGGIPSGATIVSAKLVVRIYNSGNPVDVRQITSSWSESGITYNSRPSTNTTAVASFSGSSGEREVNLTSLFTDWFDGSAANHGVELHPTGSNGVDIRSSEYSTTAQRPKFVVEYLP